MRNKTHSVKNDPIIIGKIWAKWCPHCIALIPAWDKMKKIISKKLKEGDAQYMEVEEEELHKIDEYNKTNRNGTFIDSARGYPTIYKIVGGKIEYYQGSRDPASMASWVLNKKQIDGGKIRKTRKLKSKKRVKV